MQKNGNYTSWTDKVANDDVLRKVNKDKQILNAIWMGHILRYDGRLRETIKGRMTRRPNSTRGRAFDRMHSSRQLSTFDLIFIGQQLTIPVPSLVILVSAILVLSC